MERNCKRKEKKNKTEKGIFSPGWLYQPGLEVVALRLGLEPPLVLEWQSRLGNQN